MRDLQRQAKAQAGAGGRVRDHVAQSLHISSARVAKYDSILNNLTPALMKEIKADRLPVSTAYELSCLPEDEQLAAYTGLHEDKPVKAPKPRRQTAQPELDDVFQSNTQLAAEPDDFSDIDPVAIREALAERGIINGEVVDPEKLNRDPFIQRVMADVGQTPQADVFQSNTQDADRFSIYQLNDQPDNAYLRFTSLANIHKDGHAVAATTT